jgi:hypothetical protein
MQERKEISDLGFMAALITLGHEPVEARKQGSRVLFTFEWNDNMSDMEEKYFSNDLEVDARTFQGVLRRIKIQYLYAQPGV